MSSLPKFLRKAEEEVPGSGGPGKMNREAWLNELAKLAVPVFSGYQLKPYRLTCGWPSKGGMGRRSRRVGECHSLESSKGGVHEIFISPLIDESLEVGGTVLHELAHVAAGITAGHGKGFRRVCRHVGLVRGKPTAVMPGDVLNERLQTIIDRLGPYPHQAIRLTTKPVKPKKSLTLTCDQCGCRVSMSIDWLDKAGAPLCACGGAMCPPG